MPDYSEFEAMLQRGSEGAGLGPGYRQSRALMKAKGRVMVTDSPEDPAQPEVRARCPSIPCSRCRGSPALPWSMS